MKNTLVLTMLVATAELINATPINVRKVQNVRKSRLACGGGLLTSMRAEQAERMPWHWAGVVNCGRLSTLSG